MATTEDNKFSFGNLPVTAVYFGSQKVTKISLGNIDIYNNDGPTPPVTYDHSITYNTENFHGFTITGPAGYNDGDEEVELLLTCDAHRYPTQEGTLKTWPDGFTVGATLTAYVTGDGPIKLTELSGNDVVIGAVSKYFGQVITLHVSVTGGEGKDIRYQSSSDWSSNFSMDVQVPHGSNINVSWSSTDNSGGIQIRGDASHLSTSTIILSDNLRYEQSLNMRDETANYRVYSTSPAADWWPDDIYMTATCDQAHDLAGKTFIIDNVAEAVDRWFYCNKNITTNAGDERPQVDDFVSLSPSGITSNSIHMKGVVDGFISPLGAKGVNAGAEGYYLSDNDEIIRAVSYGTYNSGSSPTVTWADEAYRTIKFDNVHYVNSKIEQFLLNYGDEVL